MAYCKWAEGGLNNVFLLSDGKLKSVTECSALLAKHAGACRLFTFGCGSGVSKHAIRALARTGAGTSEFILSTQKSKAQMKVRTTIMSVVALVSLYV